MSDAPDAGALRAIVGAALSAPSGDNSQPWRFAWDGEELAIAHDAARGAHPINRANLASLLALGCAIEAAALAATRHGLATAVALGACGVDGGSAWARLRFAVGAAADPLADALALRCTDRRPFAGGDLPGDLRDALTADAAPGVALALASPRDAALRAHVVAHESALMRDAPAFTAVLRWLRLTRGSERRHRDGMGWRNIGARRAEVPALALMRAAPPLVDALGPLLARAQRASVARQVETASALIAVAVRPHRAHDLVAAGRTAMRAWLRLTSAGFGVQPLTLSSLHPYAATVGAFAGDAREASLRRGADDLARAFVLPAGMRAAWMLRTGPATPLPEPLRTLRRDVADVLDAVPTRRAVEAVGA